MLLKLGEFTAASGTTLPYRIDCSSLDRSDLECIAEVIRPYLDPYGKVVSVSKDSKPFANIFKHWVTRNSKTLLLVDTVWVTGQSMRKTAERYMSTQKFNDWQGVVLFARSRTPMHVRPFMMALY